jgi:hypothetical protein
LRSRFARLMIAMLVAIGNASSRIDSDPPACTISGTPNGSPDLVFRSKRLMSEDSLTGRLSLWRGSWMVASVSP